MAETFRIVRHYLGRTVPSDYGPRYESRKRTLETGLTLQQAQAHCQDRETSSRTATSARAQAITRRHGPWFDGYERE